MKRALLTLNAGSASLKFAVFDLSQAEPVLLRRGHVERRERVDHTVVKDAAGLTLIDEVRPAEGELTDPAPIQEVLRVADDAVGSRRLVGIGHRIVHGGLEFSAPARLDEHVLARLDTLRPLAPLHQPQGLDAVRTAMSLRPGLLHTASFDTTFHHTLSEVATRFALPRRWHERGVRKYGFHGLSYQYIARRLPELDPALAPGRVVVAHLGAGASLCMIKDGRSIETTMGFTALDGLVMGTRCGAIDPGVILYMLQQEKLSPSEIEDILYRRSGLLGVSAHSADMGVLLESVGRGPHEAIELFTYRIARETGALMAAAGGLDGFVFTAGIGEHEPDIRQLVADRLGWTGMKLDPSANAKGDGLISAADSSVRVWVIPTDEERVIARDLADLLGAERYRERQVKLV